MDQVWPHPNLIKTN